MGWRDQYLFRERDVSPPSLCTTLRGASDRPTPLLSHRRIAKWCQAPVQDQPLAEDEHATTPNHAERVTPCGAAIRWWSAAVARDLPMRALVSLGRGHSAGSTARSSKLCNRAIPTSLHRYQAPTEPMLGPVPACGAHRNEQKGSRDGGEARFA